MEDAVADPARSLPDPQRPAEDPGSGLVPLPPASLPAPAPANAPLKYVDEPARKSRDGRPGALRKDAAVVRGIKDLQQLQKQTIAVLESVKSSLDDIGNVLRSPEATRGMEKQRNAATLLSRGFAHDAVEQAQGAVALLPANPEAHLLLALSLAADQQFDQSLAATRKGLGLFDRRQHPLAIEAGLLHALAAMGHGGEAAERWAAIIVALPAPVLLDHLPRIIACYPSDAPPGQLDEVVVRRLNRLEASSASGRVRRVETRPEEMPAAALLAGVEAARDGRLGGTHRTLLGQIASRLKAGEEPADIVRFLSECMVPLAAMPDVEEAIVALARSGVKRLLRMKADAMMLHRAMGKLELAGADKSARELAGLLNHWRRSGSKARAARRILATALLLVGAGVAGMAVALQAEMGWLLWAAAVTIGLGMLLAVAGLMGRTPVVTLPGGRGPLSGEELRYLRTPAVKASMKNILAR
jgi:hypothetical protein